jgi:hypothetical protein
MRRPLTIWPYVLPFRARTLRERETYKLNGRYPVERDSKTGKLTIRYLRSINGGPQETSPQPELGPGGVNSDLLWKTISVFNVLVIPCVMAVHLSNPDTDWIFFHAPNRPQVILLIVLALFIGNLAAVAQRFNALDRNWQTSIGAIFDPTAKVRMLNIQSTLTAFRTFVKWRRFLGYLLTPAWLLAGGEVLWWFCLLLHGAALDLVTPGILLVELVSAAFLSYMRWFHTDLRDPTLHINVMIAEDFQAVEAARRQR